MAEKRKAQEEKVKVSEMSAIDSWERTLVEFPDGKAEIILVYPSKTTDVRLTVRVVKLGREHVDTYHVHCPEDGHLDEIFNRVTALDASNIREYVYATLRTGERFAEGVAVINSDDAHERVRSVITEDHRKEIVLFQVDDATAFVPALDYCSATGISVESTITCPIKHFGFDWATDHCAICKGAAKKPKTE